MLNEKTAQFVRENGPWTAMAIRLPDGSYTREPAVDHRLKRLLQVAIDVLKKPIADCRVLDLACLEGHYAIEFGAHGAEAVGIEGRAVSIEKCNFAKEELGLHRINFTRDDVRNFNVNKYGKFDVIVCSGILYHLTAEDAWGLIKEMRAACSGILLLDTFVSLSGREALTIAGLPVRGHHYTEHVADDSKDHDLWASLDNERSFWFTVPSLINLLIEAGFSSVLDVLVPEMPANLKDRKTYLAVAGERVRIKTSDPTDIAKRPRLEEGTNRRMDGSQLNKSPLHKVAKRLLPQPVKDLLKPALRAIRILPPDLTPDFLKDKS